MATAQQRQAMGRYGEDSALRHLTDLGMVLLDRNWRCELGELDLVLRDGDVLVFCEVKTRATTSYGSPLEGVTNEKLARLRRLGARWLEERGLRVRDVRIDLLGICLDAPAAERVAHVRGVC